MKASLKSVLKVFLFLGFGFSVLYLIYQHQQKAYLEECASSGIPQADCSLLDKVLTDFSEANFFWLLMVLIAFAISNLSRATRWRMLLGEMGYKTKQVNAFFTIMLGYFGNLGFPRIGEIFRGASFSKYEGIPFEKVMGTVAADRAVDVLSIILVTILAFSLEFDRFFGMFSSFVEMDSSQLLKAFILFVLSCIPLFFLIRFVFKKYESNAFISKVKALALGFWEGIISIAKLKRPGMFIFHSVVIWLMYYLMTLFGLYSFAPTEDLGAVAALLIFVVGSMGIVIPSPGGMGTYHFLVTSCLSIIYGVSSADGFSLSNIVFFTIQIGANVLFGLLALLILPIYNKGRISEKASGEELTLPHH